MMASEVTMRCLMMWVVWATAVGCGDASEEEEETETETETEPNCGDTLICVEGEFCLATQAAGGEYGDEEYSCETLPEGCDSLDHMCFDEPPCLADWAAEVCPTAVATACSVGLFGDQAYCQL